MSLSLADLTARMHAMVSDKGWDAPHSARRQTPRNIAISLVLEASEVLEHFQWGEASADRDALAAELADVLLYLMQLASVHDIDLEGAVLAKIAHNYTRSWDDETLNR
ncbi:MAG: nucleotide pyrophosphohydrolase [Anaerolineales bacterium]